MERIGKMEFHELACVFPMMQGTDINKLADDIKANGLQEKIVLYEGKILDGRNRYAACVVAEIEPTYTDYNGKDPLAFVISKNLHRRHLNESQRAMIAANVANLPKHLHKTDTEISVSQQDAAQMFSVSSDLVSYGKMVKDNAIASIVALVENGRLAVSEAKKMAMTDKATQNKFAQKVESGVKPTEARRQIVSESYAGKNAELGKDKKYRVVYADPPWQYGNTSAEYLTEQRDHYKTMPLDEIAAMPIEDILEDDAVLFLWVTSPILEESFEIVNAWGFKYKASFVWDKVKHVMGHYNSVRHEMLLVCVRGSCQPDVRKLFDSVYSEERGEHSAKPEHFRSLIDTIYPNGNRIELFARAKAKGWDAYGNDLP